MSFLSGLATGAQSGLQMGAGIRDVQHARAVKRGETPAATGLYGQYREIRDLRNATAGRTGNTAMSPAAGAAQTQPEAAPVQAAPAPEAPVAGRDAQPQVVEKPAAGGIMGALGSAASQSLQKFRSIIKG